MADKYTYADVIIDPNDPRVEIGAEYYSADVSCDALDLANHNEGLAKLIEAKGFRYPFHIKSDSCDCWTCLLIRKKEKERYYVPFNLSNEEDRARLRGAWVRHKKNPERENLITGIGNETVDFAVYFGDVSIGTDVLLENFEFIDGSPCGKLVEEE